MHESVVGPGDLDGRAMEKSALEGSQRRHGVHRFADQGLPRSEAKAVEGFIQKDDGEAAQALEPAPTSYSARMVMLYRDEIEAQMDEYGTSYLTGGPLIGDDLRADSSVKAKISSGMEKHTQPHPAPSPPARAAASGPNHGSAAPVVQELRGGTHWPSSGDRYADSGPAMTAPAMAAAEGAAGAAAVTEPTADGAGAARSHLAGPSLADGIAEQRPSVGAAGGGSGLSPGAPRSVEGPTAIRLPVSNTVSASAVDVIMYDVYNATARAAADTEQDPMVADAAVFGGGAGSGAAMEVGAAADAAAWEHQPGAAGSDELVLPAYIASPAITNGTIAGSQGVRGHGDAAAGMVWEAESAGIDTDAASGVHTAAAVGADAGCGPRRSGMTGEAVRVVPTAKLMPSMGAAAKKGAAPALGPPGVSPHAVPSPAGAVSRQPMPKRRHDGAGGSRQAKRTAETAEMAETAETAGQPGLLGAGETLQQPLQSQQPTELQPTELQPTELQQPPQQTGPQHLSRPQGGQVLAEHHRTPARRRGQAPDEQNAPTEVRQVSPWPAAGNPLVLDLGGKTLLEPSQVIAALAAIGRRVKAGSRPHRGGPGPVLPLPGVEQVIIDTPGLVLLNGKLQFPTTWQLVIAADGVQLRGVDISGPGGFNSEDTHGLVEISGKDVGLARVTVTQQQSHAASAAGVSQAAADAAVAPPDRSHAVVVRGRASAKLTECKIVGADCLGLLVRDARTRVVATHCTVSKCGQSGFAVANGGRLKLVECQAVENRLCGFYSEGEGRMEVGEGCLALRNGVGFTANYGGRAEIASQCRAEDNSYYGFHSRGSHSYLKAGKGCVAIGGMAGFFAEEGGKLIAKAQCTARGNQESGFAATDTYSKLQADAGCRAEGSGQDGFAAVGGAKLTAGNGCVAVNYGRFGFMAAGAKSKLAARPGCVAENGMGTGSAGFCVHGESTLEVGRGCIARGNTAHGFWAEAGGYLHAFSGCVAIDNRDAGFLALSGGKLAATTKCESIRNGKEVFCAINGDMTLGKGCRAEDNGSDGFAVCLAAASNTEAPADPPSVLKAKGHCIARGNGCSGFLCEGPGCMMEVGPKSEATANQGSAGFHARDGAKMTVLEDCTASHNAGWGFFAEGQSTLLCLAPTCHDAEASGSNVAGTRDARDGAVITDFTSQ